MSFQPSAGDRVLPPIMTFKSSSSSTIQKPVLPPVSCLAPPIPPLISPITPPPDYSSRQPQQSYMLSPQKSEHSSPNTAANGHFHFQSDTSPPPQQQQQQQYIEQRSQSFSPPRVAVSSPQQLSHMQSSSHHPNMMIRPMHHPYAHPIYHQQTRPVVDPASELLAEKRRRNAGASARFRDRRKQREREMQEKCQFLERRVQELENTDSAKRIAELEKKLEEANAEKDTANQKLQEQEKEIHKLRSQLCNRERDFDFLTPPSSTGEYESKEILFDTSRLSRSPSTSSTTSDHQLKPTDVKSLLS
ncbi:hypothetical protein C1645_871636 [Glomus cerebriforme]|uniref:BZIP domain-containing protein n=1 Tax=Glomus cerebriforme TaxID=658196 RepID=A0A397TFL9_9GLOM|nr:hypothetical protein C1645_871636 [Glomus cerebriforme]